ncbi:FadR/GntR family transcriptional regulator [Chthonobacter rhizosphaerae]|uniref:FadR/GntR family transcriptional regulator n=1 Tax=Chthonobacter rhizosphaerae TaxID=2735553 RepID=UPI0015EF762B|nr:FadR/GntR family transcriptional regulator [Chthonobacter rhizosphaerae]
MSKVAAPKAKPKRAERVIDTLRARIASGALAAGGKLPTEVELIKEFGVSRTVVREAVAVLSADGLVQARQGAGVFVLDKPKDGLGLLPDLPGRLTAVLDVLEVRMAVEIEAAGLAAQRRTGAQEAEIREAFERFNQDLETGQPTGNADFAFHRAIAEATNNPYYVEILDVLGRRTIPRDLVSMAAPEYVLSKPYLETMQAEHAAILEAIARSEPAAAREAMRTHLAQSQRRYQVLFQKTAGNRTVTTERDLAVTLS